MNWLKIARRERKARIKAAQEVARRRRHEKHYGELALKQKAIARYDRAKRRIQALEPRIEMIKNYRLRTWLKLTGSVAAQFQRDIRMCSKRAFR